MRAAHAAMREVARAHEENIQELDRARRAVADARGDRDVLATAARDIEVGHARSRELYGLVVEASDGIRDAMRGRRVDSAALVERAGLIRADPFDDIPVPEWFELYERTAAPPSESPVLDDRPTAVEDDTDTDTMADGDTAVQDDTVAEDTVAEETRPSAVLGCDVNGRVLANWPQYQDAHRIRDPDLDVLAQALDEITAGKRERWEAEFDEADDLDLIVTDVHDDHHRDRESDYRADDGDADGDQGSDEGGDEDTPVDDPGEPPPPAADTDSRAGADGAVQEVPDPLEQARRALAEVRLDLIEDAEQNDDGSGGERWHDTAAEDGEENQR
ncbi:hypothetical protein FVA95_26560 [Pseudonocardia sp. EV170527-09]|uniref:hypothetical protein n=1 Tax=Pseudonocardia sp. EV170527-09 TaxID=2603411 RepID=UPI0011F205C7|nr:hypothetical protein [Pseudonocardia sp. EV170527-09]KAA1014038.1 hypothetical protein FVA95_26560 [Pseudonocardia sp. EV170527-09]